MEGYDYSHLVGAASTGLTHIADLYAGTGNTTSFPPSSVLTRSGGWSNTVFTYYDYGQSFTTNRTVFAAITNAGPTTNAIRIGFNPYAKMEYPSEASVIPSNGVLNVKGYGSVSPAFIIRWDVANGFDFR